jgi:Zn finger protein HypA/HybF involved in hydrogenase expression
MEHNDTDRIIGFQKLVCKNPACHNIIKEIYFFEGWEKRTNGNNGAVLVKNNGSSYYVCPKCSAKNFITQQGEKIIIEKIIRYEVHR